MRRIFPAQSATSAASGDLRRQVLWLALGLAVIGWVGLVWMPAQYGRSTAAQNAANAMRPLIEPGLPQPIAIDAASPQKPPRAGN